MNDRVKKAKVEDIDEPEIVDCIFIGTSPICLMEACYQVANGKKVAMVDSSDRIGGAWSPIDLFGLHDVENAIHYFLQSPIAFEFMRKTLGWEVVKSEKKYRVFETHFFGIKKLPYDNVIGRIICQFLYVDKTENIVKRFFSAFIFTIKTPFRSSVYLKYGSVQIINSMIKFIDQYQLRPILNNYVKDVQIIHSENLVYIKVYDKSGSNECIIRGKKIYLTHGTKIDKIGGDLGEIVLDNKIYSRPAVHILVNDPTPDTIHELIFMNNPLIKYVHDITKYTREAAILKGKKKIFVLALKPDVIEYPKLYDDILYLCKKNGMVGENAFLEDFKWWDVFLPSLEDPDIIEVANKYQPNVEWMSTENFTKGIGINAERWSTVFKKN
jgi:hypothetical protein